MPAPAAPPAPRALTFDYWDTLYDGTTVPERAELRLTAMHRLLSTLGRPLSRDELQRVYEESGAEAHRWWKEEHRGYTTADRVRWILTRLEIERPEECEHIAAACDAVDAALLSYPPPLLPGAADAVRILAKHFKLGIISDTGFASGRAQDALLARDGLLDLFPVRIYSMDIGHAKPRAEPFLAAVQALGVSPPETIHFGDIERTDIKGALAAGLRAIRCDIVPRQRPASAAETVVRSFADLLEWLDVEAKNA